jgi:inner membrane protein
MIDVIIEKPEIIWFIVGLFMFILELLIPGFFIFFFGVGAWITALVCLIGEPSVNVQILIFAVTSVLSLIALRRIIQKKFFNKKQHLSEEIEDEFTDKEAVAVGDFGQEKYGKVDFKGTTWKSESESQIKDGQSVIIIKKNNFTLIVKPKNN